MPNAFLNKLSRWAEFTHVDRLLLSQLPGEALTLQRGEAPLPDPDRGARSILMLDGWAGRCKDTASGQRVIGELLLPGDVQLYSRHRDPSLSTIMLSSGTVLLLSPATFATLAGHSTIGPALDWAITVQQSIHREWLVNIGKNKVYARLAHLLCEIGVRMNNAGLLSEGRCAMPLTQADLADALSMTMAHLNIALQRLRSENIVRLDNRILTIVDRRQLETIAQYDDRYLMRWPTDLPDRRGGSVQPRAVDRRRTGQLHD